MLSPVGSENSLGETVRSASNLFFSNGTFFPLATALLKTKSPRVSEADLAREVREGGDGAAAREPSGLHNER